LHPCNGDNIGSSPCESSDVDSISILKFSDNQDDDLFSIAPTPGRQPDDERSLTSPSNCSSLPTVDSNGCNRSLPGRDKPQQTLQPHDPVSNNGKVHTTTTRQGVMLMDICFKIFCSVMNARAFKLLAKHGTRFQFGGTPELGCRDALFVLKTMLNMQKNHNLLSYVGFVDLVKAYDTANHDLLIDIRE
jgi:hypothetical protein